jgi:membrane protein YqaA with SNARE-associated domain
MNYGAVFDALWPYATMFVSAFVSATLLPFASEAVLLAQLKSGYGSALGLLAAATVGNVGGSTVNWWMGRLLLRFQDRGWFPFKPADIARASERFQRFGTGVLLLSWVPIIGDPLTLVAGVLRVPLAVFLVLVTVGKLGRYLVVAHFS